MTHSEIASYERLLDTAKYMLDQKDIIDRSTIVTRIELDEEQVDPVLMEFEILKAAILDQIRINLSNIHKDLRNL
jgi:hypothetical protein